MKVDRYTTLHRKDERGVIVDSRVFGPDDEIPEGFGEGDYQPIYAPREDDHTPVDESNVTPWENGIKPNFVVDTYEDQDELTSDPEADESGDGDDELDEGSILQARQQAGEELTEAEQEALAAFESDSDESSDGDELGEGSPRQAREQSEGGELTDAEEEADEQIASDESSDDVQVPPQGGPGSGKDAWAAYAAANGVTVEDGATRDEIIAACKKAGVPVD